jgi:TonB family protein
VETDDVSSASPSSTFDVAALHRVLAQAARKCYPAAARRFQLKGTAQVEFCLAGEGALASTHVTSSSGEALLDAAAVRCVIPNSLPLPKDAFGRCFRAPVRFGFESAD